MKKNDESHSTLLLLPCSILLCLVVSQISTFSIVTEYIFLLISLLFFFLWSGLIFQSKCCVLLVGTFFPILCFEVYFAYFSFSDSGSPNSRQWTFSSSCFEPHEKIDYWAKPNSSCMAGKKIGDEVIFEQIEYSFDARGFRECPLVEKATKHALFLGGSFTFGEGLSAEDTLPCQFQNVTNGDFKSFNLAKQGFGIGEMYILLKELNLKEVFEHEEGVMMYGFMKDHFVRTTGDFSRFFWSNELKNTPLFRSATAKIPPFETFQIRDSLFLSSAYKLLTDLRVFSPLVRRLTSVPMPLRSRKESIDVTIELVSEVKRLYESRLNGTFYLLVWPRTDFSEQEYFIRELKKRGVGVIHADGVSPDSRLTSTLHPLDNHPSKHENRAIAKSVARSIRSLH